MDYGTIFTTFVIVFREALEASLIVGIILTVLARMNQKKYFPHVFASSALAIGISIVAGFALLRLTESAQGDWSKIIEGGISLLACCILTYMVFWMDTQARNIKPEIESQLETAISQKEYWTILTLPFLAIFREGAETVLFLSAVAAKNSAAVSTIGAVFGFILAVIIVAAIFIGGKRIPLKPLFKGTSIFILFIAAGLLAYGIHELQEVGWIPELIYPLWNINHILNEKEGIGAFLKGIFGYNGNPSLIEVVMYVVYMVSVFWTLNLRNKTTSQQSAGSSS